MILFLCTSSYAQKTSFSISSGINRSKLFHSQANDYNTVKAKYGYGFDFNGNINFKLNETVILVTGISIHQYKNYIKYYNGLLLKRSYTEIAKYFKNYYIGLPIKINYTIWSCKGFYLFGGAEISYLLSSITQFDSKSHNQKDYYNNILLFSNLGIGVKTEMCSRELFIEIGYTSNIFEVTKLNTSGNMNSISIVIGIVI